MNSEHFDREAAVTRSLLGWGVVAGILYLCVGVIHGLVRPGFRFTEHALSLLTLGESGWVQVANLVLTGVMVVAAAIGFHRAMQPAGRARGASILLATYGIALILSGVYRPDSVSGFPDTASTATATTHGVLHLVVGALGFVALAASAFRVARWEADRGEANLARRSRLSAVMILVLFLAGAGLASFPIGVALIWIAVLTGWIWLAGTSIYLYRTVPHPDRAENSFLR